jgi:hypothetical protein
MFEEIGRKALEFIVETMHGRHDIWAPYLKAVQPSAQDGAHADGA